MAGQNNNNDRLEFVDAFRGVAILMVVIFHAYARWVEIYPFKDAFANNPFINLDRTGVYLFFIISGYVINISLSKSVGFKDFIWRRWLRLFPAMLLASFIVLGFSFILPNRPESAIAFKDILPGLSFIAPEVWQEFGINVISLEGAFWSLYIEAAFYLIYGIAFFTIGGERSTQLLAALAVLTIGFAFYPVNQFTIAAYKVSEILGFKYYSLFVAGILIAKWQNTNDLRTLLMVFLAVGLSLIYLKTKIQLVLAFMAFLACFRLNSFVKFFANPFFLYFGAISYPLYLVHEGIMIAFMNDLAKVIDLPPLLMPLLPIGLVVIIASFVAKHENSLRHFIKENVQRLVAVSAQSLKNIKN